MRLAWVVVSAAAVFLDGCRDPCRNDSYIEFGSPMGTRKVVVFQRSCGATTGFSTQASLLAGNAGPPAEAGNILSIDDDHGKVPLDSHGRIEVRVAFAGESTVALAYPAQARVFIQVTSRDGVAIRHERTDSGIK